MIRTRSFEYLDKDIVYKNLESGVFKVRTYNGKSDIWNYFKEVVNEYDEYVNYIICINCTTIFCYRHIRSGTSSLRSHCLQCTGIKRSGKAAKGPKTISKKDFKRIINSSASVCIKDGKSSTIFEGEEMKDYSQMLVDIGAKYGKLDISNILPFQATIPKKEIIQTEELEEECLNVDVDPTPESIIHITEDEDNRNIARSILALQNNTDHMPTQSLKREMKEDPYEQAFRIAKTVDSQFLKRVDEFSVFGENIAWTLRNFQDRKLVCKAKKEFMKFCVRWRRKCNVPQGRLLC